MAKMHGPRTVERTLALRTSATRLLVCLLVCCWLSACSLGGGGDLDKEVSRLRREVNDLRDIQAEQTVTINELGADVRRLSGTLEELE